MAILARLGRVVAYLALHLAAKIGLARPVAAAQEFLNQSAQIIGIAGEHVVYTGGSLNIYPNGNLPGQSLGTKVKVS